MSEKVESGLEVVTRFLLGECELDGYWFGEDHPSGHKYWWRDHLRAAFSDADRALSERDAEIQRQRERHRTTWTQLEQVKGLLKVILANAKQGGYVAFRDKDIEEFEAALSLQAEPVITAVPDSSDAFYAGLYKKSAPMWHRLHDLAVSKGYDHVRFAIECAPVYKCDCMGARKMAIDTEGNTIPCECVAAANEAEPAPAQDESGWTSHQCYKLPADVKDLELAQGLVLNLERYEDRRVLRIDLADRPAQTEQQPEQSGLDEAAEAILNAPDHIIQDLSTWSETDGEPINIFAWEWMRRAALAATPSPATAPSHE